MFDIPSSTSIDEWFQPFSGQADKQPPNQTEISPSRHQYLPTFEHGPHGGPSSSYEVYQSSEKKSTPQSAVEQGISKDLPTPPNSWKSNGFGYHTDLLSLQTTHDKLETAATQGRTLPLEGNAHDNGLLSDKDQGRLDQDPRVTAGKNDGFYACFFQGCNQHCRRKSDLPRHIHSVHDRMNNRYINYKCNICGRMKKCKSRIDSVTRHAKICWKKKQKMRCAKSYTSERSLDDHLFTHDHVNNDPITRYCHGCHELKKYTRPEALERHLKQCLGRKDVTNS
ncbi:hypothetical protein BDB00DRAFT_792346 [Zychaea mexicana]|uniref:uncharacterized protein n=1 Tax=Zychaea mexicana TaxID=64656 RepID=UPI0022FDD5E4|nr:uncharacterized protein BDB00DRAFT_792346 [Zychaea mexicana]KAI9485085.1 hypothetical protein BDB00DRAFT_792346 [Zychaea mexicana]